MKRLIVALTVGMSLAAVAAARADPVNITGGSVEYAFPGGLTIANLLGPDTDISATGTNGPTSIAFNAGSVGATRPFNWLTVGAGGVPELIGGTTYPPTDTLTATLSLLTSPFHADVVAGPTASFVTPFTLTGSVSVFAPGGALVATTALTGSGEATFLTRVLPGPVTGYNTQNISFQFSAASPSPTPEPAPLVLLGLGLGGVLRRFVLA